MIYASLGSGLPLYFNLIQGTHASYDYMTMYIHEYLAPVVCSTFAKTNNRPAGHHDPPPRQHDFAQLVKYQQY